MLSPPRSTPPRANATPPRAKATPLRAKATPPRAKATPPRSKPASPMKATPGSRPPLRVAASPRAFGSSTGRFGAHGSHFVKPCARRIPHARAPRLPPHPPFLPDGRTSMPQVWCQPALVYSGAQRAMGLALQAIARAERSVCHARCEADALQLHAPRRAPAFV